MSAVRLAVFDCDGTLSDGQAGVCNAMDIAFKDASLPAPDRNRVRRIVGLSLPQAIRQLAPDASSTQHSAAVEAYKFAFRQSRASDAVCCGATFLRVWSIAFAIRLSPLTYSRGWSIPKERLSIKGHEDFARLLRHRATILLLV